MIWADLRARLTGSYPERDLELLDRAYAFADRHHAGQTRLSGDPYVTHAVETAGILFELNSDPNTLAAALLHDCLEDTPATREEIAAEFGPKLAELVDGVTKISTRVFRDSEERQAENLRKMMLAMAQDIRVIVIKLADRLHNMRTLEFLPAEKRQRFARETLEIYAPLAHRLGMGRIKDELEDLAFRHLHRDEYVDLVARVDAFRERHDEALQQARETLEAALAGLSLEAQVFGRVKHLYSLWTKMQVQKKELDQVFDLLALRIIVPSVKDCYATLGVVHSQWKPLPGRFKDFIAMPKSNLYQSLHTTVIGPSGDPLEVQIRTLEMHRKAEMGIAAHWTYKEGRNVESSYEMKLGWFRQVLEWQKELYDSTDFLEALRIDLFKDEVFVFTPRGEVKSLPRGSTPIDFAYEIHSQLGDSLMGARINGRLVPLKYELKNGDIVEVMNRADGRPSRDWLNLVKTAKAKNRIRRYFRELDHDEQVARGRAVLETELQRCGSSLAEASKEDRLLETARALNYKTVESLLVQIGDGNLSARSVASKLGLTPAPAAAPATPPPRPRPPVEETTLSLPGIAGVVTRFAQCCHPISGDPIIGIITKGRGISIHRQDCPNIQLLRDEPGRSVAVSWDDHLAAEQTLEVFVQASDRAGLLGDLLTIFDEHQAAVKSTTAKATSQGLVNCFFTVTVKGGDHLREIVRHLEKVKGVLKAGRKSSG